MAFFIDTHTHLYLEQFDPDRSLAVQRAVDAGVSYMLLPNVDEETILPMMALHQQFPRHCLPMMGLHPTSVKPGYEQVLEKMYSLLQDGNFVAVGETGIDLYWDKTWVDLQEEAFRVQIEWAIDKKLPVVIHSRNSVNEIKNVIHDYRGRGLRGVMHCFPGNEADARWFIDNGFLLGIGGVVTYKKSDMAKVVQDIPLQYLILETDAPYLPPVPHRGKRNEPGYLPLVAEKIAALKNLTPEEVARQTTAAAMELFNLR